MKKNYLIFLLACCLSYLGFGQINNWDSTSMDGIGTTRQITHIGNFNNKVYVSVQSAGGSADDIYSSASGDIGFWTLTGFSPAATANDAVACMVPDEAGAKLYVGTNNYEDGGMIYAMTGASWASITGAVPPWDSSFNKVTKIVLHSAGGGNDTIFAFLSDETNGKAEIWKTSKYTIAWTRIQQFPTAYSGYIDDAAVYNDSIYFTLFNSNNVTSYIYRMNGNGDTVRTHIAPGINDMYNTFKSLAVYNGYLYAGSYNMNGANLLKYSTATGWLVVDASGLGYTYDLSSIQQLYVYRHKLWVRGIGQDSYFDHSGARIAQHDHVAGGPATLEIFVSSDGTTFRQSATSGLRDYYNFGDSWELSSLGDNIYAAGANYNTYAGQVWRSSVPLAAFTTQFGNTTCAGMFENYTNASVNAFSYKWYVNGSLIGTAVNESYAYPTPGTYTISLVAYSSDLLYSDSVTVIKTVTNYLSASANSTNACVNAALPLGPTTSVSGGTTPYSYSWSDGTHNYTGANPVHIPTVSSTFTVTVTDVNACVSTQTLSINVNPSTDLHGHVSTPPSPVVNVDHGMVYIFIHQPGTAGLDTVGFTSLDASGNYLFSPLTAGNYLIKVLPDATDFPDAVPTYYGNTFQWDSSLVYTHGCAQTDTADIQIVEADTSTGTATISGYILEGPGFGAARFFSGSQPNLPFIPGGPLKGIDVKLGKNPGGGIQARTMSDSTGFYQFDSVPSGDFKIYVDIPNLPMDSTRELIIAASDSSIQNNYYADSTMIYVIDTVINAVGIYSSAKVYDNHFSIYPNPAHGDMHLSYELKQASDIAFEIHDAIGQLIYHAPAGSYQEGKNEFTLNAVQLNLKAGVYFVSMLSEGRKYTQRIVVVE